MLLTANIFQPLIDLFQSILTFFHNSLLLDWGLAIVLLTIVVRAVLLPLTVKQFHSMQRLQRHMPELKAIQNKYKDDKQRQQQEVMKFYKENNVNPFGSCLPLVAQLPVFIALFYMLRRSLRGDICPQVQPHHVVNGVSVIDQAHTRPCGPHNGASFLFIPDLTNKATGVTLVVLLLVFIGTQFASTLLMSTPTMDKNQRLMMLLFPMFIVIFFIQYPAGLIVYWITTNVWTIGQQYFLRRRLGPITPAPAAAGASDGTARARAPAPAATGNGSDAGGGLAGLLRGRIKPAEEPEAAVATRRSRVTPPPPPPRKKKKRSGRRR